METKNKQTTLKVLLAGLILPGGNGVSSLDAQLVIALVPLKQLGV